MEVKKEEDKDGGDVKPSKETPKAVETAADSKPPGDKYSPKVSREIFLVLYCSVVCTSQCISACQHITLTFFTCASN